MKNKLSSDNNTGGYADGCYVVINHIVPGKHILFYLFRKLLYKATMSGPCDISRISLSNRVGYIEFTTCFGSLGFERSLPPRPSLLPLLIASKCTLSMALFP